MLTFDFSSGQGSALPEFVSTKGDDVRHALSVKEGWRRFVNEKAVKPKPVTRSQLDQMNPARRAEYQAARQRFHRSLVIARHPQLDTCWGQMQSIVQGQVYDDGPGMGVALSGGPGFGKTAVTVGFAREYERALAAQFPDAFNQTNEFIPVCYSSLLRGAGLKAQMHHILRFYGHPVSLRATGADLVDELILVMNTCKTHLLCLDQAQNLHVGDKRDDQVAACLKDIMDGAHCTLILTGIDIHETGPLAVATGGRRQTSNDRLQLARRFTVNRIQPLARGSQEWTDLLTTIETQLVLCDTKPGDLSHAMSDSIWDRSQGAIGVAFNLLRVAANTAINDGSERITRTLLRKVSPTIEHATLKRKVA